MDLYNDLPPSPGPSNAPQSNAAPTASPSQQSAATLNAELDALVSSVSTSLGGWFSSARKQGEAALNASKREIEALSEAARKDLTPYLDKAKEDISPYLQSARAELNSLGERAKNSAAAGQAAARGEEAVGTSEEKPSSPGIGYGIDGDVLSAPNSIDAPNLPEEAPPQLSGLITKMHALQTQLQTDPRVAQLSRQIPNLSQIQSSISQMQAKLPEQVSRSEAYLQRAGKELSDLLGNAVRVVPPTDEELASGKAHILSRKEALLHRLRSEPAVMLVDPAQPPSATSPKAGEAKSDDFKASSDAREDYARFLQSIEDMGGLESEAWQKRISDELALPRGEGASLSTSLTSLVPEKMPAEAFWTRYFFRSHQIDQDEARRKRVLEGASQQSDDNFNWDEEEEGEPSKPESTSVAQPSIVAPAPSASERNSSEDGHALSTSSYDVVSRKVSEDERAPKADDDEDSDWE